jgi:hypothetical protein
LIALWHVVQRLDFKVFFDLDLIDGCGGFIRKEGCRDEQDEWQ